MNDDWKHGYTDEQIAAAEILYRAEVKRMYDNGYAGDFGTSLRFAMETYGPITWEQFFVPEKI